MCRLRVSPRQKLLPLLNDLCTGGLWTYLPRENAQYQPAVQAVAFTRFVLQSYSTCSSSCSRHNSCNSVLLRSLAPKRCIHAHCLCCA